MESYPFDQSIAAPKIKCEALIELVDQGPNVREESPACTNRQRITTNRNTEKHEPTHEKVPVYECVYCSKTFSQSSHKVQHERTHTGDRPFKCALCSKAFSQSSHKVKHERTHAGD